MSHPSAQKAPRPAIRLAAYTLMMLPVLLLPAAAEWAGRYYLDRAGHGTYPLFRNTQERDPVEDIPFDRRTKMSALDPTLSHGNASAFFAARRSIPGFVLYGSQEERPALRIVALGGSTTNAYYDGNWPEELARILLENGVDAVIYNGGAEGFSSSQELLKLIRDVLPMQPHIVLSLSGINDLGGLHHTTGHPLIHPYQRRIYKSLVNQGNAVPGFFPNAIMALRAYLRGPDNPPLDLNLGPVDQTPPPDIWIRNHRMMHAIATEFGFSMISFLQPALGFGEYVPSGEEADMLQAAVDANAWKGDYRRFLQDFYGPLTSRLQEVPGAVDLTRVFQGRQGMYRDSRHQTPEGCTVLAEAIFEVLRARKLLQ